MNNNKGNNEMTGRWIPSAMAMASAMATAPLTLPLFAPRRCFYSNSKKVRVEVEAFAFASALPLPLSLSCLSLAPRSRRNPNLSLSLPSPPPSLIRCSRYPRPEEMAWSPELANSVRLIGTVAKPVHIKHLSNSNASVNVVAWTTLAVFKSSTQTTWVNLTFWNDLAHVAYQHLQTGRRIFVSGRLVSDEFNQQDHKPLLYPSPYPPRYKVVVKQLNFVQNRSASAPLSFYDPRMAHNSPGSVEQRWQAFFANPLDWWDNRNNKKNPKAPDFKHKDTGEALWINSKYIPPWVNSQLEILDSKMASLQDNGRSSAVSFTDATGL